MIKKILAVFFVAVVGFVLVACNPKDTDTDFVYFDAKVGTVNKPEDPEKEGYRFAGWFRGKAGLTWLEPEPVTFPFETDEKVRLYAYFEPLNSKTVNYSRGETYYTSLTTDTQVILNPLVYDYSHEDQMIADLSTSLYATEVDWELAIADGVADYVGDFSKILAKEYSIEALDYQTILVGAKRFPYDSEGNDFTVDGKYDRTGATQVQRTKWRYEIREDIFFEDGTQVTAHTYEYSLKQYLDPDQNNTRANSYYKDADNNQGYPIKNAAEYFKQGTPIDPEDEESELYPELDWSEVGFKVIDDFTFEIETFEGMSQASAVGFGNIRLLHPEAYAASLDANGVNSTYGTPQNPFVSYGPYVIKSWDENQRIVFNKNYEYVYRETINYKSIVYEIVEDIAARMALYQEGGLSAVGLISPYYEEYAENPNVYRSWDGYPQYLIVNYAPSKKAENPYEKPAITADPRFRQALFYGFNRNEYGNTVYAPNTPALQPVPQDTKSFIQDPLYYSQSPNHLRVLEAFGIAPGTGGFLGTKARELFDQAFADFKAENPDHTGPVRLKFIMDNSPLGLDLANWIKNSYEQLFNTNPANPDKLVVDVVESTLAATNAARQDYDFDLYLASVGFGASYGIQWQYGGIGFLGGMLAAQFGLQMPYGADGKTVEPWLEEEVELDLSVTYDFLVEKGEDYIYEAEENEDGEMEYLRPAYVELYEGLQADGDKPEGIFVTTPYDMAYMVYAYAVPWDGTAVEPFPGASQELWTIVEMFEMVFFEYVPVIPTVTRSSATLYADNVTITWPEFSAAFGWGANRYRYLTSDPMFADGLYNSYKVAFENQ